MAMKGTLALRETATSVIFRSVIRGFPLCRFRVEALPSVITGTHKVGKGTMEERSAP